MFDLIRASLISIVVAAYPSFPLNQVIFNCIILLLYFLLLIIFRPYASKIKFGIAILIELSCLTAFTSSIFIIVYKSN